MFRQRAKLKIDNNVCRSLFISLIATGSILYGVIVARAQTPTQSPTPEEVVYVNGYKTTGVVEFGWRWRSLDGNVNKYRSDLN